MQRRSAWAAAVAVLATCVLALGGCTHSTAPNATASSTTTPSPTPPPAAQATASSTSTTVAGAPLAGQPGATTASLVYAAGYQETVVEAQGLRLLQSDEPADVSPTTQVHCPAVVASVGATFVCPVVTPSATLYEPLKVDSDTPLTLEFAIIDRSNFVCAAHNQWVVQAMASFGIPCSQSPTSTGQGGQGQGGQGQGGQGQGGQG